MTWEVLDSFLLPSSQQKLSSQADDCNRLNWCNFKFFIQIGIKLYFFISPYFFCYLYGNRNANFVDEIVNFRSIIFAPVTIGYAIHLYLRIN